ncbi:MAG: hypothetical protein JRJ14_04145 [Deltaproteobacteria bacterium]|nr:hypothetical protein [Deltaproteobacteria bacterium]NOR09986.1 hypothetical protein [Desulfovibrionaceae bacterium]
MREAQVSVFIPIIILLLLSGCGTVIGEKKADMAPVQSGEPVVYIHPFSSDLSQARVVVLPFLVPEGTSEEEGLRVAAVFRDVFLAKETFHTIQLVDKYYGALDEGLAIARKRGVDLLLAGRVHYVLAGTEFGGGRLDVSLRIIDTHSGDTVWYIEQTMDQLMDYPDISAIASLIDIFTPSRLRSSSGPPAVANMFVQVAADMADIVSGEKTGKSM